MMTMTEDLHRPLTDEERREAEERQIADATALRLGHKLPMWQAEIIARQIARGGPMSKLGEEAKRQMDNWRGDHGDDT